MPIFKALSITQRKQTTPLTLLDYQEPSPSANELLVRTVVVAQNPIDYKQIDLDFGIPYLPWTNGADVAGVVYKVGRNVTKFREGDRVISFMSRKTPRHAGYQTYCLAAEEQTVKLPDFVSFEDGSTMPLAFVTAAAGCKAALGVTFPSSKGPFPAKSTKGPFLVWGGSSSVGSYAIQVAKWSGYTVITTASPANFSYVRSLGADYVFDYHQSNVVSQIRAVAGKSLSLVYDTISEHGSTESSVKCITSPAGGIIAVTQTFDPSLPTPKIKILQTGSAAADDPTVGQAVYGLLDAALRQKAVKPNTVKLMPRGLLGVDAGLNLARNHKVSGEKLIYRIADTNF